MLATPHEPTVFRAARQYGLLAVPSLGLLRQLAAGRHAFETELQLTSKLLALSYSMQSLDMNYQPVREEALESTRSLVSRFPEEDRAHAQLGHALLTSNEAEADAARTQFETCLKLNPENAYCREYLARLSSE